MRSLPLLALIVGALLPVSAVAAESTADPILRLIGAAQQQGRLEPTEALILRGQRVFEPSVLPKEFRVADAPPLSCATSIVRDLTAELPRLSAETRARVQSWLSPDLTVAAKRASYLSPSGRFQVNYATSEAGGVSDLDLEPANGVPDYVERVAAYLDESWTTEVEELGFTAPDLQGTPYTISFQAMGSYGYTVQDDAEAAGTRIVLHNTFAIFPPNDDPEGDEIGAAKVTAAHELKHAIQFATSAWSETGSWLEVDATWVEDIVYDAVNDYYTYLASSSPISAPASSLDSGGGGSYDDCIWQHWMSERWGVELILDFWGRRAAVPAENILASYNWALGEAGHSIGEEFVDFAAWNYATGLRSRSDFGYEEAAHYPTAPLLDTFTTYPQAKQGSLARLAAGFVRAESFSQVPGAVEVTVARQMDSPIRVLALIEKRNGQTIAQRLPLVSTLDTLDLSVPLEEIAAVGFILANGELGGGARTWQLTVNERLDLPSPGLQLPVGQVNSTLPTGAIATRSFFLRNTGESSSTLDYEVQVLAALPPGRKLGPRMSRNIAGSVLSATNSNFMPDTSAEVLLSVTNGSIDFEWLREVHVTLPAGVTVEGSTNFVGGSAGDLVSNGAVGDSVTVIWTDQNGSWGNVKHTETALATLSLRYDLNLYGEIPVAYRIVGDGYGGDPHEVQDTFLLRGPSSPLLDLTLEPKELWWALGETVPITWTAGIPGTVDLLLSRDDGATWEALASVPAAAGRYDWTVDGPASAFARIKIQSSDALLSDEREEGLVLYEGVNWLSAEPSVGSIESGDERELSLRFDASGLSPQSYTALLRIAHNGPEGEVFVPVDFIVNENTTPVGPPSAVPMLRGNAPNPFNPSTRILFSLAEAAEVTLDIFDLRGRRVRPLLSTELAGGSYEIAWDSTNEAGRRVASGSYLYVLVVDGQSFVGRMTLVK